MAHKIISGYFATLCSSYVFGFSKGIYDEQNRINNLFNQMEKEGTINIKTISQNHIYVGNNVGSKWLSNVFIAPFWAITSPVWLPINSVQIKNEKYFKQLKNK